MIREAMGRLGSTPRAGTLECDVEMASTVLYGHYCEWRSGGRPGHVAGSGAAQALTDEHMDDPCVPGLQPDRPNLGRQARAEARPSAASPYQQAPTATRFATWGCTETEGVLAKWRAHQSSDLGLPTTVTKTGARSNKIPCSAFPHAQWGYAQHRATFWDCPGYKDLSAQYLQPQIITLQ